MQKSATQRSDANLTAPRRAKPTIIFRKRKSAFPETRRSQKKSRRYLDQLMISGADRPVNQRFRKLQNSGGFSPNDPVRPLKSHARLVHDAQLIEEEIEALRKLIWVNISSIARRTSEPQELIWPLLHGLAIVVNEFIDEKSEYEMSTLEYGLEFLEIVTRGKLRFARSND